MNKMFTVKGIIQMSYNKYVMDQHNYFQFQQKSEMLIKIGLHLDTQRKINHCEVGPPMHDFKQSQDFLFYFVLHLINLN